MWCDVSTCHELQQHNYRYLFAMQREDFDPKAEKRIVLRVDVIWLDESVLETFFFFLEGVQLLVKYKSILVRCLPSGIIFLTRI